MAITQHDNTTEEFYITHVPGRLLHKDCEREPCEVFRSVVSVPFSRYVKVLKLTLHINNNKYHLFMELKLI